MELATPQPASRAPATRFAGWLVPLGTAAGTAVAGAAGPDDARIAVIVAGAVATAATVHSTVTSLRSRRKSRDLSAAEANAERARAEAARLSDATGRRDEQLRRTLTLLGTELMPAAMEQLRQGDLIEEILDSLPADVPETRQAGREIRTVLKTALRALEEEFDGRTSAEQAVVNLGSRVQVHTNKLLGMLHEMQTAHGGLPAVARGLMELDQQVGPANLLAASIVILGGSDRAGRQWQTPQPLLSVVRGGQGQIKDFHRVDVRRLPDLAVDEALVEHLSYILAHLLDNATRYSPPTERVIVSGREVPNGLALEIQDAGKGMSEERKAEAQRSLHGVAAGTGPGGITEDAQLGLRVVGRLARRYGITVAFDESPWQGTAVVVVVPHKYFRPAGADPAPVRDAAPTQDSSAARAVGSRSAEGAGPGTTVHGLPKRSTGRRGSAGPSAGASASSGTSAVPPVSSFDGLAAFVSGSREPSAEAPPDDTTVDHSSDSEGNQG